MKKLVSTILVLILSLSAGCLFIGCATPSYYGDITFKIHFENGDVQTVKGSRSYSENFIVVQAENGGFATLRGYNFNKPGYKLNGLYYYAGKKDKKCLMNFQEFDMKLLYSFKDGKTIDLYEETTKLEYSVYYYVGNEPYVHIDYEYGDEIVLTDRLQQAIAVATPERHYVGGWDVEFWESSYGRTPQNRGDTWTFGTTFSKTQDQMFVYDDLYKDSIWDTEGGGIERVWVKDYWYALNVTAVFKPNNVNVRFNYNYLNVAPQVKKVGYSENLDDYFSEVKQEGVKLDFFGWYKEPYFETEFNEEISEFYEQDGNVLDLYAKVKEYKDIKVDLGDGNGVIDAKVYAPHTYSNGNSEESFVSATPQAPSGKYFIGWSENEDGSQRLDTGVNSLYSLMESGKTYYAVYAG